MEERAEGGQKKTKALSRENTIGWQNYALRKSATTIFGLKFREALVLLTHRTDFPKKMVPWS